jgi:hypothetical protein
LAASKRRKREIFILIYLQNEHCQVCVRWEESLSFATARSSDNLFDSCKGKAVIEHGPEDFAL